MLSPPSTKEIKIGDTVTSLSSQEKHKTRDIYLVTGRKNDKVSAQCLLHPLSNTPVKFMSREYTAHPKHLRVIHRPDQESSSAYQGDPTHPSVEKHVSKSISPSSRYKTVTTSRIPWCPINDKYYQDDSSDDDNDDQEDDPQVQVVPEIDHLPLTLPPSHPVVNIPIVAEEQP